MVANQPQHTAHSSINPYFILTMDLMTTPKVKGVIGSDELIKSQMSVLTQKVSF